MDIHPVIKDEIERIKTILLGRGFGEPILKEGPDVEIETDEEGIRYFATKRPIILTIDPSDVQSGLYDIVILRKKDNVSHTLSDRYNAESWSVVLLNPGDTDVDFWDTILDQIVGWFIEQSLHGYVFFECPKLTTWDTAEGWHRDIMFVGTEKFFRVTGLLYDEFYPWPANYIDVEMD